MDELFSLLFCICNTIAFEGPGNISRDGGNSGSNGQQGKPMSFEGWTAAPRSEATPHCRLCYSPR